MTLTHTNTASKNRTRGQATVELLLILTVLFIILSVSVSIFGTEQRGALEKQREAELTQNGYRIADALTLVGNAPIGTKLRLFLPPGSVSQSFTVQNGIVEGRSGQSIVLISIPSSEWYVSTFADGNVVFFQRDSNSIRMTTQ